MDANYPLRTSCALALLLAPLIISRFGVGTKRTWSTYAFVASGFFGVFAVAGWLVRVGMDVVGEVQVIRPIGDFAVLSFAFAVCAFFGGSFAESVASKMRRF